MIKSRPMKADKFAKVSSIMLRDGRLCTRDKMVMVALCEFQDAAGCCWPSVASLCRISGLGKTAVHEGLVVLESLGYIERQKRLSTSNYYRCSQLPINDFLDLKDSRSAEGEEANQSSPAGDRCSSGEHWDSPEGERLLFDERTGKLRLADSPPPQDELKEEKEIELIKELWKEALPLNPTGLEKQKMNKIFIFYRRHYGASEGLIRALADMVKKSKFLQGQNDRNWRASMFYCLKNRDAILSGKYTDYRDVSGDQEIEVNFYED